MKSILILTLLFISVVGSAQTFEEKITEGDKLYSEGKFEASAQAFDAAFKLDEGDRLSYYNAACSWALTGDTINSMKYLNLAADKGWSNVKHVKTDKDLASLRDLFGWNDIVAKVQANLDNAEKDLNKPLKEQLEKIYVRDQTLRQLYEHAEELFGRESEEMNYFWELMAEQDAKNEAEVIAIIDQNGWVGRNEVGGQANLALWLVIQHAPIEIQEKYLPLLIESVRKNQSSGNHLALLEDRINMRNGKPQIYGSQIVSDPETGEDMVYEVFEPEFVNARRASVGLGPIEEYIARWNIEWTVPQKEK
ncbi:MAG: hypothetical protein NWR73_01585 [Flavobacteriales bacterium]|nr:hypothetical protein [Flavobacteriales bacterium]